MLHAQRFPRLQDPVRRPCRQTVHTRSADGPHGHGGVLISSGKNRSLRGTKTEKPVKTSWNIRLKAVRDRTAARTGRRNRKRGRPDRLRHKRHNALPVPARQGKEQDQYEFQELHIDKNSCFPRTLKTNRRMGIRRSLFLQESLPALPSSLALTSFVVCLVVGSALP